MANRPRVNHSDRGRPPSVANRSQQATARAKGTQRRLGRPIQRAPAHSGRPSMAPQAAPPPAPQTPVWHVRCG